MPFLSKLKSLMIFEFTLFPPNVNQMTPFYTTDKGIFILILVAPLAAKLSETTRKAQ